ncbi:MAG: hypothetical protein PHF79_01185 [Candidatus Pacebacteria bacterium]|nr:hypothetical protein [Candidatus Paceibacterota bacterium]
MYILTVIPIARGVFKDTLSYFSANPLERGLLISVPVRNKKVPALVVEVIDAETIKGDIKSLSFATKKISGAGKTLLLPSFLHAAESAAQYFVAPKGAVLNRLIPAAILNNKEIKTRKVKNKKTEADTRKSISKKAGGLSEKCVVQMSDEDRHATYKSLVRENFARKHSTLIISPTIEETKKLFEQLSKGIEHRTFMLHSGLTPKTQTSTWQAAESDEQPVLIIATGLFAGIPRDDIDTVILERESSRAYKLGFAPFIDLRFFIEKYAELRKAKLILGDVLLRVETLVRHQAGELIELFPLKNRIQHQAETLLIDMKKPSQPEAIKVSGQKMIIRTSDGSILKTSQGKIVDEETKPAKFKIFSEELESLILYSLEKKQSLFLYCQRRGLSPSIVCGDCGTTVLCKNCSAPVVLHQSKGERFFLCHHCGERRSAAERCVHCDSWKLVTLGIGIDTVAEALQKLFKEKGVAAPLIFKIDRDSAPTEKLASLVAEKFRAEKSSILIGTEMALPYLGQDEKNMVDNTAIVSLDSLFALPDFRINERIMHTLITLLSRTKKYFLIQSRMADQPVLDLALQGNLTDFYRQEYEARKSIAYPPFSTFIKISLEGPREKINREMQGLKTQLESYEPYIFPAFIATIGGNHRLHMLIRLPSEKWPDEKLFTLLMGLPPHFSLKVDPESLL